MTCLASLRALRARQPVKFSAFYSSQLGGIVTDPALMVIPFDDHMVHRGHGIFDTAGIVNGRIYDLEAHLDRFLGSAERSKLKLFGSREEMRDIIIRTTAVSGLRDGAIRYWLSSGPGSLELSPAAGAEPGFFVMIFGGLSYPGALVHRRAARDDDDLSDQAAALRDHEGDELPAERPDADGGERGGSRQRRVHRRSRVRWRELEHERRVRHAGWSAAPSEVRARAAWMHVAAPAGSRASRSSDEACVNGVEVCDIPVADARAAREMVLLGSSVKVAPIVEWDGQPIGNGKPGPIAKALLDLMEEDMRTGDRLIEVPY